MTEQDEGEDRGEGGDMSMSDSKEDEGEEDEAGESVGDGDTSEVSSDDDDAKWLEDFADNEVQGSQQEE